MPIAGVEIVVNIKTSKKILERKFKYVEREEERRGKEGRGKKGEERGEEECY